MWWRQLLGRLQLAVLNSLGASWWLPTELRGLLYRACGVATDPRAVITAGQRISSRGVRFGYCFVNVGCLFDAGDSTITIGDRVALATGVTLNAVTHAIGDGSMRMGPNVSAPIHIGDGAWLGTNVVVLAGVSVGEGAVVAANSLVREDVPAHTLVGGVPATPIRDLGIGNPGVTGSDPGRMSGE